MNSFLRKVYLLEIHQQCSFAMNAAAGLDHVAGRLSDPDPQKSLVRHQEVFRSIHSFLTHASNVSRLLWPTRNSSLPRGRHLRQVLGLPDDEHVLKNRQLRDHLEHFDERLDDWQVKSKRHNYLQDTIGSPESFEGADPGDRMRCFDPRTQRFHFRGELYDLNAMLAAVKEVQERVGAQLRNPIAEDSLS